MRFLNVPYRWAGSNLGAIVVQRFSNGNLTGQEAPRLSPSGKAALR